MDQKNSSIRRGEALREAGKTYWQEEELHGRNYTQWRDKPHSKATSSKNEQQQQEKRTPWKTNKRPGELLMEQIQDSGSYRVFGREQQSGPNPTEEEEQEQRWTLAQSRRGKQKQQVKGAVEEHGNTTHPSKTALHRSHGPPRHHPFNTHESQEVNPPPPHPATQHTTRGEHGQNIPAPYYKTWEHTYTFGEQNTPPHHWNHQTNRQNWANTYTPREQDKPPPHHWNQQIEMQKRGHSIPQLHYTECHTKENTDEQDATPPHLEHQPPYREGFTSIRRGDQQAWWKGWTREECEAATYHNPHNERKDYDAPKGQTVERGFNITEHSAHHKMNLRQATRHPDELGMQRHAERIWPQHRETRDKIHTEPYAWQKGHAWQYPHTWQKHEIHPTPHERPPRIGWADQFDSHPTSKEAPRQAPRAPIIVYHAPLQQHNATGREDEYTSTYECAQGRQWRCTTEDRAEERPEMKHINSREEYREGKNPWARQARDATPFPPPPLPPPQNHDIVPPRTTSHEGDRHYRETEYFPPLTIPQKGDRHHSRREHEPDTTEQHQQGQVAPYVKTRPMWDTTPPPPLPQDYEAFPPLTPPQGEVGHARKPPHNWDIGAQHAQGHTAPRETKRAHQERAGHGNTTHFLHRTEDTPARHNYALGTTRWSHQKTGWTHPCTLGEDNEEPGRKAIVVNTYTRQRIGEKTTGSTKNGTDRDNPTQPSNIERHRHPWQTDREMGTNHLHTTQEEERAERWHRYNRQIWRAIHAYNNYTTPRAWEEYQSKIRKALEIGHKQRLRSYTADTTHPEERAPRYTQQDHTHNPREPNGLLKASHTDKTQDAENIITNTQPKKVRWQNAHPQQDRERGATYTPTKQRHVERPHTLEPLTDPLRETGRYTNHRTIHNQTEKEFERNTHNSHGNNPPITEPTRKNTPNSLTHTITENKTSDPSQQDKKPTPHLTFKTTLKLAWLWKTRQAHNMLEEKTLQDRNHINYYTNMLVGPPAYLNEEQKETWIEEIYKAREKCRKNILTPALGARAEHWKGVRLNTGATQPEIKQAIEENVRDIWKIWAKKGLGDNEIAQILKKANLPAELPPREPPPPPPPVDKEQAHGTEQGRKHTDQGQTRYTEMIIEHTGNQGWREKQGQDSRIEKRGEPNQQTNPTPQKEEQGTAKEHTDRPPRDITETTQPDGPEDKNPHPKHNAPPTEEAQQKQENTTQQKEEKPAKDDTGTWQLTDRSVAQSTHTQTNTPPTREDSTQSTVDKPPDNRTKREAYTLRPRTPVAYTQTKKPLTTTPKKHKQNQPPHLRTPEKGEGKGNTGGDNGDTTKEPNRQFTIEIPDIDLTIEGDEEYFTPGRQTGSPGPPQKRTPQTPSKANATTTAQQTAPTCASPQVKTTHQRSKEIGETSQRNNSSQPKTMTPPHKTTRTKLHPNYPPEKTPVKREERTHSSRTTEEPNTKHKPTHPNTTLGSPPQAREGLNETYNVTHYTRNTLEPTSTTTPKPCGATRGDQYTMITIQDTDDEKVEAVTTLPRKTPGTTRRNEEGRKAIGTNRTRTEGLEANAHTQDSITLSQDRGGHTATQDSTTLTEQELDTFIGTTLHTAITSMTQKEDNTRLASQDLDNFIDSTLQVALENMSQRETAHTQQHRGQENRQREPLVQEGSNRNRLRNLLRKYNREKNRIREGRSRQKKTEPPQNDTQPNTVYDYTTKGLTRIEKQVLSLGKSFIITQNGIDIDRIKTDIATYIRRLKLHYIFRERKPENTQHNIDLNRRHRLIQKDKAPQNTSHIQWRRPKSTFQPDIVHRDINRIETNLESGVAAQLTHRKKDSLNIPHDWKIALDSLKKRVGEKEITITQADKGGGIIALDQEKYIEKGNRYIIEEAEAYEETFKPEAQIIRDITRERDRIVKQLKDTDIIPTDTATYATHQTIEKVTGMKFYYKIHKTTDMNAMPVRPLQSCIGSPTQHLSQVLTDIYKPYINNTYISTYIRDTNHTLYEIDGAHLRDTDTLTTADVVALYPSIEHEKGLKAIENFTRKHIYTDEHKIAVMVDAYRLVITENYVKWQGKIFKQTRGVAMGTPVAVTYANIYMDEIDKKVEEACPYMKLHKRYIDDNLYIIPTDKIENFKIALNNISPPALKFTVDCLGQPPHMDKLPFLDIAFYLGQDREILTRLYTKSTDKHQYLLPNSQHPRHIIRNIPKGVFARIRRLCKDDTVYLEDSEKAISWLKERGYKQNILTQLRDDTIKKNRWEMIKSIEEKNSRVETNKEITDIPFINTYAAPTKEFGNITLKQQKDLDDIFRRAKVNTLNTYRRKPNLGDMLIQPSLRIPIEGSADIPKAFRKCGKYPHNTPCPCLGGHNKTECRVCAHTGQENIRIKTKIARPITCESKNTIYTIWCDTCGMHYIGETQQTLRDRFTQHLHNLHTQDQELYNHFRQPGHNPQNMRIAVLETLQIDEPMYRKIRESTWIRELKTYIPHGLNQRVRESPLDTIRR